MKVGDVDDKGNIVVKTNTGSLGAVSSGQLKISARQAAVAEKHGWRVIGKTIGLKGEPLVVVTR